MVNTNALKGLIISKGMTQKEVCERIGLTKRQWQTRMENKKFDSDDLYKMIDILGINNLEDVKPIFFANRGT